MQNNPRTAWERRLTEWIQNSACHEIMLYFDSYGSRRPKEDTDKPELVQSLSLEVRYTLDKSWERVVPSDVIFFPRFYRHQYRKKEQESSTKTAPHLPNEVISSRRHKGEWMFA